MEDIGIERAAPSDGAVPATVDEIEPLGAFTIIDLAAGEYVLRAQVNGQPGFRLGEPVQLCFDFNRCHLFDGRSGKRLTAAAPA